MFPKETRVLVVDDMMTMRKIVRKHLTDLGFTKITDAPDGAAAWEKIKQMDKMGTPFELVISDWMMPNMVGIELLRHVRTLASMEAVPFILLTAESEKDKVVEAIAEGVSHYIVKPFTIQTLAQKLQQIYQSRAAA